VGSKEHDYSDRAMNIRAARAERLERFTITGDNAIHATCYEPSPPEVLDDMLLEIHDELSDYVFVDLGSGKGRVLCVASAHPFRRIVGVEFAEELHRAAVENLKRFKAPWRRVRDIRSILCDASCFEWPSDPLVIFLFNPFRAPVLGRIVENLTRSHAEQPRSIYVLYYMPEHAEVLERSACFRAIGRAKNWAVYGSR
jgi:Histone methylation protein DOT1